VTWLLQLVETVCGMTEGGNQPAAGRSLSRPVQRKYSTFPQARWRDIKSSQLGTEEAGEVGENRKRKELFNRQEANASASSHTRAAQWWCHSSSVADTTRHRLCWESFWLALRWPVWSSRVVQCALERVYISSARIGRSRRVLLSLLLTLFLI